MKIIVYHERLGDVARCLPLAKHFADRGEEVAIECWREYHGLLARAPYAFAVSPGHSLVGERLELQIWPHRFNDFTQSGLNWMDYVYRDFPGVDRQIVLHAEPDRAPAWVREAVLVFPNGYSQCSPPHPHGVVIQAHSLFPGRPVCVIGKRDLGCHELPTIPDLIDWIAAAAGVVAVNTGASIIASAVRREWNHIPDLDPQHDFTHPRQIRVGRLA
jgi:hypothetical protein